MTNRSRILVAALILCAAPALAADAPDPIPTPERAWALDLGVDASTHYLFRGVSLLEGEGVLVPHARFGYGHLAVYSYGYLGKMPGAGDRKYREVDLGADYTFVFGERVALTVGAVTLQYNLEAERDLVILDTYEAYVIVAVDSVLSPTLSFYRDLDAVKGGFLTLGISQGLPLGDRLRLVFSGSVGYDFGYNNEDAKNGTVDDVLIGLDVPFRINDALSVHAMVQRSIALKALDDAVERDPSLAASYGDRTVVSAGLSFVF